MSLVIDDSTRTKTVAATGSATVPDPYVELKRVIANRGLLLRAPRRQILPAAGHVLLLALVVAGVAFTRGTWLVLVMTVPAALLFAQVGFLAHDATHNQILTTSRANYVLSVLLFNLCLGGVAGGGRRGTTHITRNPTGSASTRTSRGGWWR